MNKTIDNLDQFSNSKSWVLQKDELEALAHQIEPTVKLRTRDHWVIKTLSWLLWVVSFGKFDRHRFTRDFATTIGNYHFYPEQDTAHTVANTLLHEARHTRQFRIAGLFIHPLLGVPGMFVLYCLFPLPILFAFGRLFLEIDADITRWRMLMQMGYYPRDIRAEQSYQMLLWAAKQRALSVAGWGYLKTVPESWAVHFYQKAAVKLWNATN